MNQSVNQSIQYR